MLRTFSDKHLIQSLDGRAFVWQVSENADEIPFSLAEEIVEK